MKSSEFARPRWRRWWWGRPRRRNGPGLRTAWAVGGWLTNYKRFNVLPEHQRLPEGEVLVCLALDSSKVAGLDKMEATLPNGTKAPLEFVGAVAFADMIRGRKKLTFSVRRLDATRIVQIRLPDDK